MLSPWSGYLPILSLLAKIYNIYIIIIVERTEAVLEAVEESVSDSFN